MIEDKLGLFGDSLKLLANADYPLTLPVFVTYSIFIFTIIFGIKICFTYIFGMNHILDQKNLYLSLAQSIFITLILGTQLDIYSYNAISNIKYERVIIVLLLPSMAYTILRYYKDKETNVKQMVVLVASQFISITAALCITRTVPYSIWSNELISKNILLLVLISCIAVSFMIGNIKNHLQYYDNVSLMLSNIGISFITMLMIIMWQACVINLNLKMGDMISSAGLSVILLVSVYFAYSEYHEIIKNNRIAVVAVIFIPHVLYSVNTVFNAAGGI